MDHPLDVETKVAWISNMMSAINAYREDDT